MIEQVLGLNGTVVIRSGEAKRRMFRGNQSNNEVNLTSKSESVPNVNGTLVFVSIPCR